MVGFGLKAVSAMTMERASQYFVNFSLLLMPVSMVLYKSAASTYVGVCLLWSLVLIRFVPSKSAFHKWEKILIYTVLAYVSLALFNLFWEGYNHVGAKQLGYIIRLLAVIPILVVLHRARPNLHLLMLGLTCTY
jgi:glucose-6-phosphate-specific signal transduction histidine kinase